jgi:hypothetical protein
LFLDPVAGAIVFASLVVTSSLWAIFSLYIRERTGAPYEVLLNEQTWDLHDPTGQHATHIRRSIVRFLQNDTIAMRDYIWGDGPHIALDYTCQPGRAVDFHKFGSIWHVLISLDEVKHRGDTEEFRATRRMEGSFTESTEWVAFSAQKRTQAATVIVLFPKERPCKKYSLTTDMGTVIPNSVEEDLDGDRQRLTVHVTKPPHRQPYILRWEW